MRRILFTTPLLVLSALAAAAGSSAAHHAVICPGEAGIGCCPPLAHCCAGIVPQQCPTLTIAASPDPSLEGKRVKISGQLFGTSSVSHVKIVLWEKLAKQHSFHRVLSTRTNSGGHYSIVRRAGAVKTNRAWYVVANGLRSATVHERVRSRLTLTDSIKSASNGERVTFHGQVTPAHPGQHVVIQQRTSNGWSRLTSGVLDSASRYTIAYRFTVAHQTQVRAVLGGDARNVRSFSKTVTLF